ncbi:MAG TPA: nucleoside-diphosphate kinase [Acidimicrobiales bacterium]|jgi:nucleoside-diphosphate kinase|nr:nucleoside-diphosphate kinase [Acidimicrobiales bacterium]
MNRTLVIVKPDAVERGLVGAIIGRLERKGLRLVAGDLRTIERDVAEAHYAEHRGRPFFDDLVAFICRSPVFVMVVEGPEDTWRIVRTLMGPTDPVEAPPGTIRGDFATNIAENLVHGSDGPESAAREIALFFPGLA